MKPEPTRDSGPPTPKFRPELDPAPLPPEVVAPYLAELRKLTSRPVGQGGPVDSEAERVYLAACEARKATRHAPAIDTTDDVPF